MYPLGVISTLLGLLLCIAAALTDTTVYSSVGAVGNIPAQHDQLLILIGGGIFLLTGVLLLVGAKIIDAINGRPSI